jgi:hypothetical protein
MTRTAYAAVASLALLLAVVVYYVEPAEAAWLPRCPLHWLTGWHCPGCGSTRAAHALLHGDLRAALGYNALVVGGAPLAAVFCIWGRWRLGPNWASLVRLRWIVLVIATLALFGVLRNVPVYPLNLLAPHAVSPAADRGEEAASGALPSGP